MRSNSRIPPVTRTLVLDVGRPPVTSMPRIRLNQKRATELHIIARKPPTDPVVAETPATFPRLLVESARFHLTFCVNTDVSWRHERFHRHSVLALQSRRVGSSIMDELSSIDSAHEPQQGPDMPTSLRNPFSYFILTLAAAFTLMLFIPARFYAVSVAPATPAIASIAQSTTRVARSRHHRSWRPATLESVDRHTAAGAMLALMLVRTGAR